MSYHHHLSTCIWKKSNKHCMYKARRLYSFLEKNVTFAPKMLIDGTQNLYENQLIFNNNDRQNLFILLYIELQV